MIVSYKLVRLVFERSTATDVGVRLLLVALADFADDSGRCYPSIPTIVARLRVGERHARRLVTRAIATGELIAEERKGGRHRSTRYVLMPGKTAPQVHLSADGNPDTQSRVSIDRKTAPQSRVSTPKGGSTEPENPALQVRQPGSTEPPNSQEQSLKRSVGGSEKEGVLPREGRRGQRREPSSKTNGALPALDDAALLARLKREQHYLASADIQIRQAAEKTCAAIEAELAARQVVSDDVPDDSGPATFRNRAEHARRGVGP